MKGRIVERRPSDPHIDAKIEALARKQHGAISRRQALHLGASSALIQRRRKAKRWSVAAPGVYVLAGWPRTFRQRVAVGVLRMGDGAFAAASCAAVERGLDGVETATIQVATHRTGLKTPKGMTVCAALPGALFDEVDGIQTATATEIVVQLAFDPDVAFEVVESVFESAQRRGLTSHDAVRERVSMLSKPGVVGIRRARAVLGRLVDDGSVNHSELETKFFQLLRGAGLPLPERQQVVARNDGRFAHADYGYPGTDGLIELVGFRWHSASDALQADVERGNDVMLANKRTVQFTWDHVARRRSYVIDTMQRFLRQIGIEDRYRTAQE